MCLLYPDVALQGAPFRHDTYTSQMRAQFKLGDGGGGFSAVEPRKFMSHDAKQRKVKHGHWHCSLGTQPLTEHDAASGLYSTQSMPLLAVKESGYLHDSHSGCQSRLGGLGHLGKSRKVTASDRTGQNKQG